MKSLALRERIKEVILTLKGDPIPFRIDIVKLRGYENVYRIRIGDLRIVYEVDWSGRRILIHFILIHFIGSRGRAYRRRL